MVVIGIDLCGTNIKAVLDEKKGFFEDFKFVYKSPDIDPDLPGAAGLAFEEL